MMFCSKLGISFPDPSGRICELVEDFKIKDVDMDTYKDRFNQVLYEDSSVLPLWHQGFVWYFSKDIVSETPATVGIPRFDLIKLKD